MQFPDILDGSADSVYLLGVLEAFGGDTGRKQAERLHKPWLHGEPRRRAEFLAAWRAIFLAGKIHRGEVEMVEEVSCYYPRNELNSRKFNKEMRRRMSRTTRDLVERLPEIESKFRAEVGDKVVEELFKLKTRKWRIRSRPVPRRSS